MEKVNECSDPMSANDDTPWPGVKGCRKRTSLFESPAWLGITSLKYRDKLMCPSLLRNGKEQKSLFDLYEDRIVILRETHEIREISS